MESKSNNVETKKKKGPPKIRQTLTSLYRLAKANPLLVMENKLETEDAKPINLPEAVTSLYRRDTFDRKMSRPDILPRATVQVDKIRPSNKPNQTKPTTSNSTATSLNKSSLPRTDLPINKSKVALHSKTNTAAKPSTFKIPATKNEKPKKGLRRSLSAEHFGRKFSALNKADKVVAKTESTQSLDDINTNNLCAGVPNVSAIVADKKVSFKTPNNKRRSTSMFGNGLRMLVTSTPGSPSQTMNDKLNEWLRKKGKSLSSYHHLKCIGVQNTPIREVNDENKENIEKEPPLSSSYENLKIDLERANQEKDADKEIHIDYENLKHIVKAALQDLHKLVQENYSVEQCEAWLAKIRHKYKNIEEDPHYWECRAAIEQTRGNISSALECYQTAIVKGAEVKNVDESLDHLLEKFSLLNIDSSAISKDQGKRGREMNEVRNIFKSSIIQFAVQERSLKKLQREKNDKKFTATPVRRSTRSSRSTYRNTPNLKICNSLHELESSIQNSLSFHNNSYLH